ncbi:MAG: hypothetical protein K9J30_02310 [Bacteroidales bacterium]|nr:hypothetical protein [Bacteroidales bacterium]
MILRWPRGIKGSRQYDAPVSLMDIFTTVCTASAIPLPGHVVIDGKDLINNVEFE